MPVKKYYLELLKSALSIFLIFTSMCIKAQTNGSGGIIQIDYSIYETVDVKATYVGGLEKFSQFVNDSFIMPLLAKQLGISGILYTQFVVEIDGSISNLKVIAPKDKQLGYVIELECMRVIKLTSGNWKPAMRAGKDVRTFWRFPFEVINLSKQDSTQIDVKVLDENMLDTTIYSYSKVDEEADYSFGQDSFNLLLNDNFNFPNCKEGWQNIGMMYFDFVVEIDGSINSLKPIVLNGSIIDSSLNEEYQRVLNLTNRKWKPAIKNNKEVRSYFRQIFFQYRCKDNVIDTTIYYEVDKDADYKYGQDSFFAKLDRSFRMPKEAKEANVSGRLIMIFTIELDGSIINIHSIAPKEKQLGYGIEEEFAKAILLTNGDWIPATKKGKEVRSYWFLKYLVEN